MDFNSFLIPRIGTVQSSVFACLLVINLRILQPGIGREKPLTMLSINPGLQTFSGLPPLFSIKTYHRYHRWRHTSKGHTLCWLTAIIQVSIHDTTIIHLNFFKFIIFSKIYLFHFYNRPGEIHMKLKRVNNGNYGRCLLINP